MNMILSEGQWIVSGSCRHCSSIRYSNLDLNRHKWDDESGECLHVLEDIDEGVQYQVYLSKSALELLERLLIIDGSEDVPDYQVMEHLDSCRQTINEILIQATDQGWEGSIMASDFETNESFGCVVGKEDR